MVSLPPVRKLTLSAGGAGVTPRNIPFPDPFRPGSLFPRRLRQSLTSPQLPNPSPHPRHAARGHSTSNPSPLVRQAPAPIAAPGSRIATLFAHLVAQIAE